MQLIPGDFCSNRAQQHQASAFLTMQQKCQAALPGKKGPSTTKPPPQGTREAAPTTPRPRAEKQREALPGSAQPAREAGAGRFNRQNDSTKSFVPLHQSITAVLAAASASPGSAPARQLTKPIHGPLPPAATLSPCLSVGTGAGCDRRLQNGLLIISPCTGMSQGGLN